MLPPEDGLAGWLRFAPLPSDAARRFQLPSRIVVLNASETSPVLTGAKELQSGIGSILGQRLEVETAPAKIGAITIGTVQSFSTHREDVTLQQLRDDGFWLDVEEGWKSVTVIGQNERGVLYGVFELLSLLAQGKAEAVNRGYNPSAPIRWGNQWDNLDGSIERGYGGRSIFFKDGFVVEDMERIRQFARLLASVRLNGLIVNNVNAHFTLLTPRNMEGLRRIADTMRAYGIRIGVSLFFDSPKGLGGLPTSDPLDPSVVAFWQEKTAQLYSYVPDLLGYLIKANSEGQPGPLTYGRTLAEGANMFARALRPHGDGVVMYRAFVYNHHLDESDPKNDRANAAVEYFKDLDGTFDENVIVQIKYGPIDFQVREPPSPLFANLRKTPAVIEFMVAQEYLGQQSHMVYEAPLWKTILDFDLRIDGKKSLVSDVVSGRTYPWKRSGFAAVINVGDHPTWLGSHMAMANLYAYGRLTWDPSADAQDILQDWIRLTFGIDPKVVEAITKMNMESWPTYESYSGNLGIQTLCDILYTHYGPSPASMDGNGWGQWTRADAKGLGMDRTVATGTGNAGQYPPEVAARFEKIETTPDDLVLWFHHVPYDHVLKSGKTVIQHFYDAHYEGAATAQTFPRQWEALKGLVDEKRFEQVAFHLRYQAGHAIVWRDFINRFYHSKCGIADGGNRVGNHQWRIPAASMTLDGYEVVKVTPPEAATDAKAIAAKEDIQSASAKAKLNVPSGTYDIAVNYYDHDGGTSQYELFLNNKAVGTWRGDLRKTLGHDFSEYLDGHSATRITFNGVEVKNGEELKIVGKPDGKERAPLDYVSIMPVGHVD